jgi:hypothetical protein
MKVFAKENIYLKDGHLFWKEHLVTPILCLKRCSRKIDLDVTKTQILQSD